MLRTDPILTASHDRASRLFASVLIAVIAMGCSGDGGQDRAGSAGGGSQDASEGPTDADLGTGTTGDAGAEGADGSTAGGSGGDGSVAADGSRASLDDVDLTLGGFNQDLPAPAMDCSMQEVAAGCMAISGEYNEQPFSISCKDESGMVQIGASHNVVCRGEVLGGEVEVRLALSRATVDTPPVAFAADAPAPGMNVIVQHFERELRSYDVDGTHDQTFRVAGLSERIQVRSREDWRIDGVFAFSLVAQASCTPDAMGSGCDEVRLRGNFRIFPIEQ